MIRRLRKLRWRIRVWLITYQAGLAKDRAELKAARKSHKPCKHILDRMKRKRMEAMQ